MNRYIIYNDSNLDDQEGLVRVAHVIHRLPEAAGLEGSRLTEYEDGICVIVYKNKASYTFRVYGNRAVAAGHTRLGAGSEQV